MVTVRCNAACTHTGSDHVERVFGTGETYKCEEPLAAELLAFGPDYFTPEDEAAMELYNTLGIAPEVAEPEAPLPEDTGSEAPGGQPSF